MQPNGADIPGSEQSAKRWRKMLETSTKRAGIYRAALFPGTATRLRTRAHDLRGAFVTYALANGRTETWVADRTGHKSSVMINRYRQTARTVAEAGLGDLIPLDVAVPEVAEALAAAASRQQTRQQVGPRAKRRPRGRARFLGDLAALAGGPTGTRTQDLRTISRTPKGAGEPPAEGTSERESVQESGEPAEAEGLNGSRFRPNPDPMGGVRDGARGFVDAGALTRAAALAAAVEALSSRDARVLAGELREVLAGMRGEVVEVVPLRGRRRDR